MHVSSRIDGAFHHVASYICPPIEHFVGVGQGDSNPAIHRRSEQTSAAAAHAVIEWTVGVRAYATGLPSGQSAPQRIIQSPSRALGRLVCVAGLVWIAFLGIGFYSLAREEFTPVVGGVSAGKFPPSSTLTLSPDSPTLILFAHPHCPCTWATLREFEGLWAALPHRVAATIIFALPNGVPPRWEQGDLWRSATKIPGVRVITDQDGREARRFGVKGSGHVLLYKSSGDLVFSGGITPSRGHEGDNPGRSAVIDLINCGRSVVNRTPVYGCPLLEAPSTTLQQ